MLVNLIYYLIIYVSVLVLSRNASLFKNLFQTLKKKFTLPIIAGGVW